VVQIESFIPLWEWDLPKKKGKKKRAEGGVEKVSKKGKKAAKSAADASADAAIAAGATIEEVVDSGAEVALTAQRRAVTVEDVPDED
jgi:translocation protein SEC62